MRNQEPAPTTGTGTGINSLIDTTMVAQIDFGALLLDTLGLAEHEFTAIGYADTAVAKPQFKTAGVRTPTRAVEVATRLPDTADVYFSVNAVRARQPEDSRRGVEADTTRLTALYADLDVKPGGCPTLDVARAITAEIGVILGTTPATVVESGSGLHPYWVIEDGHVNDGDITAARSLVRRFGRLVTAVAKNHRVAVDGVYDLARMLRVPGTFNNKTGGQVPVVAYTGNGRPLSMAEVAERLDEVGIEETAEDRAPTAEIVSAPTGWVWAETTCGYVAAMIAGWATDTPTSRNPWHYANRIRLECARRNGCLTEADYRRGGEVLAARLTGLVATTEPRRSLKRLEISGAAVRAVGVAATKTDADVRRELGGHNHGGTLGDFWGTGATPTAGGAASIVPAAAQDPDDSGQTAAQGISPAMGRRVELTTFADIRDDTPEWVWSYDGRGRIQRGTFTLFGGRPGAGKSTAARWFVAGFSTGTLDGCFLGRPQNVAYIAAEESGRYVVKPSLRAAGADLNRIYFPTVTSDGRATRLQSVADENELTELLIANNITVVVVDPVMSTIGGGVDIHRNNETRQYIEPWARIAERIDGVVIGIAHLRKATGGDVVTALTGSSAFGEVARSVFGFAKDPDSDDGERVMSQAKNSTGVEDLAVTYRIESMPVTTDAGTSAEVARFVLGARSERTVDDLLRESVTVNSVVDDATEWLREYLTAAGRSRSKDVKAAARNTNGYSESSLKRAARKLRVVSTNEGMPRVTWWSLPVGSPSRVEEP
ncbi:conserved hypothetical protein [uncultured Mycobacterium sp.]|uniref:Uncharacterized protein n=1 Tax=uncultured Mycobacterium sp. TaxID=171292 RepID=A0A1Y5NWW3_9MYCO|nr:conserved hypothetical protein [uncultured Mycobacterium sp.]